MAGSNGLIWKRLFRPAAALGARIEQSKKRSQEKPAETLRRRIRLQLRTRKKSFIMMRDLVAVFFIFAAALVLTSVLDLHGTFEAASLQLKNSPFQYDEIVASLGIMAAALSAFAVRRWHELEVEIDERLGVEDALSESEERYRTLAEAAQDFIFILAADGRISYINTYAAAQLGRPAARIVGESGSEVLPAGMLGMGEFNLAQIFDDGHPLHLENRADFADRETWQSVALVPIFDDEGRVGSVLGISRDITERKLAEDQLVAAHDNLEKTVAERTRELKSVNLRLQTELDKQEKSEESLRAVNRALRTAKAANHALVNATDESELLAQICRAAVDVGGYRFAWVGFAQEDEVRKFIPVATAGYERGYLESVRINWDEGEFGRGPHGAALRTGAPSVVRDILSDPGYGPWREESRLRGYVSMVALPLSTNGRPFGVLSIYAAQRDAFDEEEVALLSELAGDLAYGIGALRTRGERDEQAVTLKRTGEQLSLLLESLPIIFYTSQADGDFDITYVSDNVEVVAGYEPAEITSEVSFWVDRIHPDDAPRIFEDLDRIIDRGLHEYEYRWRTAGGSYKWFLDIHRMVKDPAAGSPYIVGMWLDITSRKTGEESLLKVKEGLESEAARRAEDLNAALARLADSSRELDLIRYRASVFASMEEILQNCLEVREALGVFEQFAVKLFPEDSGCVYTYDAGREAYRRSASWGQQPPASAEFAWDDCWSLRQQQPHGVREQGGGARCRHIVEQAPYICVPLKAAGRSIGVLTLLTPADAALDSDTMNDRLELARDTAERLSAKLYNLKLREILIGRSIEDPFGLSGHPRAA